MDNPVAAVFGPVAAVFGPVATSLLRGAILGTAVFLVAVAVRLLDDYLDEAQPVPGSASGAARAVYAAACVAAAAGLAPGPSVCLFLGAYAVGMTSVPLERLPTRLPGWAESLVALALAAITGGPALAGGAASAMGAVQAFDDFWDTPRDRAAAKSTLALAIGPWPALGVAVCLAAASLGLSFPVGLASLAAGAAFVVGDRGDRPGRKPYLSAAVAGILAGAAGSLAAGLAGGSAAGLEGGFAAGLAGGPALGLAWGQAALGPAECLAAALGSAGGPAIMGAVAGGATLVVSAGLILAYRRGLARGFARGRELGRAAAAIEVRADRLDGRK